MRNRLQTVGVQIRRAALQQGHAQHADGAGAGRCVHRVRRAERQGMAVQVYPVKLMFKAPGSILLKPRHIDRFQTLLSSSTCAATSRLAPSRCPPPPTLRCWQGPTLVHFSAQLKRSLWDRKCIQGLFGGGCRVCYWALGVVYSVFCVRNGSG